MTQIRREGGDSVAPTDSRTAAENESQSQHADDCELLPCTCGVDDALSSPVPWQEIDGNVYASWSKPAPFTDLKGVEHPDYRSGLIALVYGTSRYDAGGGADGDKVANADFIVRAANGYAALLYELDTLCQAIEGHRAGALTNDGLWHYRDKARAAIAKIEGF